MPQPIPSSPFDPPATDPDAGMRTDALRANAVATWLRPSQWLTGFSLFTYAIGLILTLGASTMLVLETRQTAAEREARQAAEIGHDLDLLFSDYLVTVRGLAASMTADPDDPDASFDRYVEAAGIIESLPGLRGVEWAIAPHHDATEVVIAHIKPDDLAEFVGADLAASAPRRSTIERALESGRAEISPPVDVAARAGDEGRVVVAAYHAVRADDGTFLGIVGALLDLDVMLAELVDAEDRMAFAIADLGTEGEETPSLLFESDRGVDLDGATLRLDLSGRVWEVTTESSSVGAARIVALALALSAGLLATTFLAFTIGLLQRWGEVAEDRAQELNADLRSAYTELEVTSTRLRQGMRSADVELFERDLDNGQGWTSGGWANDGRAMWVAFLDRVHPDDLLLFADDPRTMTPGSVREIEFRFKPVGSEDYRWTLARSVVIERGGRHYLIGAQIDVTDRHVAVEEVRQLNGLLRQSNQSLREFTRVASHDLRAPLRAIHALVGFLREDLGESLPEEAANHLVRIEDRVGRLGQLIDDLLAYARADHRHDVTEAVDVAVLIDDIVASAEERGGLRIEVDADVPTLQVSPTPLATCIRNLVDNAVKYHDRPADGVVRIVAEHSDGQLWVTVTDDGPGIDPAHHEMVWQPFRRLHVASADTPPGSGVGLSVIKRMAEAHDGSIMLDPTPGRGTTFELRWPAAEAPQPADDDAPSRLTPARL